MNRLISVGEVRLGLRLIAKQPILSATIFLALAIAGGVACWLPVRRALSIRPAEALSAD